MSSGEPPIAARPEHARRTLPRWRTPGLGWQGWRWGRPLISGAVGMAIVVAFLAVRGGPPTDAVDPLTGVQLGGWNRLEDMHLLIVVNGASSDGNSGTWRIETNSPNILKRRGWAPDSISAGDEVVIEGFPANDGSNAMRVYRVRFADGRELIGQRPAFGIER